MTIGYNANIIQNNMTVQNLTKSLGRSGGPVGEFYFSQTKPKKQLKELRWCLLPEKKKLLFIKYGFKFNLRDTCIVCGSMHRWDISDPMRPPLPLSEVTKGRPLKGTFCPKHAGYHKQFEMLEQKILAEENGIEFRAFIPKARMPSLRRAPVQTLSPIEMSTLIGAGWAISPPQGTTENAMEQYTRLMVEIQGKLNQIQKIIPYIEQKEE